MASNAHFDFVESVSKSYLFFWENRRTILQLALVPLAIKIVLFIGITILYDSENYLRQGLLMLPAYFAEGWLVAQLIRMAIFDEIWPIPMSERDEAMHRARARSIPAAMGIYVLIKLALAFVSGYVLTQQAGLIETNLTPAESAAPPPGGLLAGILVLMLMLWAFRFLWLYIPAAMDYSVGGFLRRIKPFRSSFSLLGAWLLCFVPISLALVFGSKILLSIFPGAEDTQSAFSASVLIAFQGTLEVFMASVSSVAVAFGVKSIYDGTNKPTSIL